MHLHCDVEWVWQQTERFQYRRWSRLFECKVKDTALGVWLSGHLINTFIYVSVCLIFDSDQQRWRQGYRDWINHGLYCRQFVFSFCHIRYVSIKNFETVCSFSLHWDFVIKTLLLTHCCCTCDWRSVITKTILQSSILMKIRLLRVITDEKEMWQPSVHKRLFSY